MSKLEKNDINKLIKNYNDVRDGNASYSKQSLISVLMIEILEITFYYLNCELIKTRKVT
jgi:hypothetical protein